MLTSFGVLRYGTRFHRFEEPKLPLVLPDLYSSQEEYVRRIRV
jgi:hypothetical protein